MGAQAVRLSNVDIDNALKDKDFEVLFQPIFDLGNGALARVETFVRWRHPSLGVLPPGAFISFFETQGRMSELTRYVLSEALAAYQGWRGSHPPGFSINLALSDLSDESFASHLTVLLRDCGFPAELVTLECPMPAVDADTATVSHHLQRLAATGARLAIEVRGRANDFLKTVHPFPFAEIKTGGAAILRFARTVRGPGLSAISELLELAAAQNAAITAVGVEDQASLAALRGLGFAAAQGNHLGKVGALSHFMPSHVNDVRTLLGLEPLSSDDLAALFRTGGPKLAAIRTENRTDAVAEPVVAPVAETPVAAWASVDAEQSADALVERLAARIARVDAGKERIQPQENAKAAAIARARRKTLARERLAAARRGQQAVAAESAPRDLQDRLSREFESFADSGPSGDIDVQDKDIQGRESLAPADHNADLATVDEPSAPAAPALRDPALEMSKTPAFTNASMGARASAHFTQTIRVAGPEARPQERLGDLHKVEAFEPEAEPAPTAPASVTFSETETGVAEVDGVEWTEETVAVVEPAPETPKRRQDFLTRKYDILPAYSGYFWPRPIRRRMKKAFKRTPTD